MLPACTPPVACQALCIPPWSHSARTHARFGLVARAGMQGPRMPSASAQPMRYGSLINPAEGSYINKPYDIRSVLRIVSLEQRVESDVEVFHLSLEDEQVCLCREACPRRMGWRVRRARVPRAAVRAMLACVGDVGSGDAERVVALTGSPTVAVPMMTRRWLLPAVHVHAGTHEHAWVAAVRPGCSIAKTNSHATGPDAAMMPSAGTSAVAQRKAAGGAQRQADAHAAQACAAQWARPCSAGGSGQAAGGSGGQAPC